MRIRQDVANSFVRGAIRSLLFLNFPSHSLGAPVGSIAPEIGSIAFSFFVLDVRIAS
jgi:hypothetical protein